MGCALQNMHMSHSSHHHGFKFASLLVCMLALPLFFASSQTVPRNQDYFRNVVDLAQTLGQAHAVRVVCNGRGDQYWRKYMQSLLELEAPFGGSLRRSMVNGFNAGFSEGSDATPACNAAAISAEKTYAAKGQALANQLAAANMPGSRLVPTVEDGD